MKKRLVYIVSACMILLTGCALPGRQESGDKNFNLVVSQDTATISADSAAKEEQERDAQKEIQSPRFQHRGYV